MIIRASLRDGPVVGAVVGVNQRLLNPARAVLPGRVKRSAVEKQGVSGLQMRGDRSLDQRVILSQIGAQKHGSIEAAAL